MNRKLWLQTAAGSTLAISAAVLTPVLLTSGASAQQFASATRIRLQSVQDGGGSVSAPAASQAPGLALSFGAAAVGAAPRHLTANFAVSGLASALTPSVTAHFGHDYSFGPMQCSGGGDAQTCSLDVVFTPTLPGSRQDALFLSTGSTRLATVMLDGTGQSPLSLLRSPADPSWRSVSADTQAVVDENGTLFALNRTAGTVTSTTASGATTLLPIAGLEGARSLQLDAAGVLYLLGSGEDRSVITFDTVQQTQGVKSLPVAARMIDAIALDPTGDLYALSGESHLLYRIDAAGSVSATPSSGLAAQTVAGMVFAFNGNLVAGGESLRTISPSGSQSAIDASSAMRSDGLGGRLTPISVDAAGSLYVRADSNLMRLSGPAYGVASRLPWADAIGTEGSAYVATTDGYARTDPGQTVIDFGGVAPEASADARFATLYNGGNLALTISSITLTGADFQLSSPAEDSCAAGVELAAGASCQIGVGLLASHTGTSSGTVTVLSNSLNSPSYAQSVGLIAHAALPSKAVLTPTKLAFPNTTVNTLSKTVLTSVLSNPGGTALNFTSIALTKANSGSFGLTQNCFTTLPASLAPGASCTLTVSFTPLSATAQVAAITLVDDAGGVADSTQTVALSGLGTPTPAPVITFLPTQLTFGSGSATDPIVVVGTTSAPQTINIFNSGNADANISALTLTTTGVSLEFNYTTTCGSTLAVGANCAVTIVFSPNGNAVGITTLSVSDNGAGSPQSATITGLPTAGNYNVTTPTTTLTIPSSGGSASMVITATPIPIPFPTPIAFSPFGLPGAATYSFSPVSISPMTAPATTTFTISIPPYHSSTLALIQRSLPGNHPYGPVMAAMVTGLCFALRRRKSLHASRLLKIVLLGAMGLGVTSMSGCYGGFTVGGGVPPGSYIITVSAQSANGNNPNVNFPVHNVNVTLIVQ